MAGGSLKLYHSPITRSVTAEWYMKELQLEEAQIVPVDFMAGEQKGEEYRKINPFGRLPALVDGDMKLFETGAILMYLAEAYSTNPLYATAMGRVHAAQWISFANTTLSEAMFNDREKERYQKDVLSTLDHLLSKQQYLDGDGTAFGVADVGVGATLLYAGAFLPAEVSQLASYPNIVAYVDKLMTRPGSSNLEMLKQGWREKVKGEASAAGAAAAEGGAAGGTSIVTDAGAAKGKGVVAGAVAAAPAAATAGGDQTKKQRTS